MGKELGLVYDGQVLLKCGNNIHSNLPSNATTVRMRDTEQVTISLQVRFNMYLATTPYNLGSGNYFADYTQTDS